MVYIDWNIEVWWTLTVHYENGTEFQWYRDWEAIVWETSHTYTLLITDQWHEITCAVYYDWDIEVAEPLFIDYYSLEVKPSEKEYIVKLYDWSMNFVKVLTASLITNDISFSESINAGQGQLQLNVNLPIDTDYFDNIRYCKIFVYKKIPYIWDNIFVLENGDYILLENWWKIYAETQPKMFDSQLLYSWRLSKINRSFSNNKENIQTTFLSLYTLLNDIYFMQDWEMIFQIEDDPANIIKAIIDYFDTLYPWILSYTEDSIDDYWEDVYLEFDTMTCGDALKSVMNWLSYYIFIWADWVIQFHNKPQTITHNFTYEKDITALTIPEDYEQVANAVRANYKYIWWSHTWITDVALDNTSIAKFWRKEIIIWNENLYWQTAGETYRDSYLNKYKNWKKNITLTVSTLYDIESVHPGDTVRIRNFDLSINNLQISKIDYTYEYIRISLEYYTSIAQEIFKS